MPEKVYYIPSTELARGSLRKLGEDLHRVRAAAKEDIITCANELDAPYWEVVELELGCADYLDITLVRKFISRYKHKLFLSVAERLA